MLHFLRDNITPRKTQSTMQSAVNDEEAQLNEVNKEAEDLVDNNPTTPVTTGVYDDSLYKENNPPSTKSKRKRKMELEDELMVSCLKEMEKTQRRTFYQ